MADTIISILLIIAVVIVLIGAYPYIVRILKTAHAVGDSASDFYHHHIKQNNSIMKNKRKTSNENEDELYIDPDAVRIDESELNITVPAIALSNQMKVIAVNQMHSQMIQDINRKRPVTLWGQERMINKIRNDNIKIELLIDQMGMHGTMISEAAKLEAKIMYAPNLVQDELEKLQITGKFEKEVMIAKFMDEIDELSNRRKQRDFTIKLQDAEHQRYIMETTLGDLERRAKINTILAHNSQEKVRASLMETALELFEEGKLSEKLQAYLIISVFNFGDQGFVDLNTDEELAELLKKEKKQEVNKKKWDTRSSKVDYEHKKEKNERERKQRDQDEEE